MVHFGGVCPGALYDEIFDGGFVVRTGLDIGSTTIKCVVLDDDNKLIYSTYERHLSQITEKIAEILDRVRGEIPGVENAPLALSGSAGMGVAQDCGIEFVQEVFATRVAANTFIPGTDVVIELGGEDAKILFLSGGLEVRMNGTCAGGTGAFIDQMATLLNVPLPCSTRARARAILRRAFLTRWSARPLPDWRRDARLRDRLSTSAVRSPL